MEEIIIKGARENNLKNVSITLPKNKYSSFSRSKFFTYLLLKKTTGKYNVKPILY